MKKTKKRIEKRENENTYRITTGMPKFDKLMCGGFPNNTVIIVSGGPGGGKTLFGMNYLLEGARKGEWCCYISLNESREEIIRACKCIKSMRDVDEYIGSNLKAESIKLGDGISMKKFVDILAKYPKLDRLVVDDINKLLVFSENKRDYRIKLSELVRNLRKMGCTLLLCETKNGEIDTGNGEAFEADGVLHITFLDMEEKPKRIIEINKMRYTDIDPMVAHGFNISSKGISLSPSKII